MGSQWKGHINFLIAWGSKIIREGSYEYHRPKSIWQHAIFLIGRLVHYNWTIQHLVEYIEAGSIAWGMIVCRSELKVYCFLFCRRNIENIQLTKVAKFKILKINFQKIKLLQFKSIFIYWNNKSITILCKGIKILL